MVFAVQCPNPQCRKFQLVEERDCGKTVPCLLCKSPIRVANGTNAADQTPARSGKP